MLLYCACYSACDTAVSLCSNSITGTCYLFFIFIASLVLLHSSNYFHLLGFTTPATTYITKPPTLTTTTTTTTTIPLKQHFHYLSLLELVTDLHLYIQVCPLHNYTHTYLCLCVCPLCQQFAQ